MKKFFKKLRWVIVAAVIFVLPFLPIIFTYLPSCDSVFFYTNWQLIAMKFTVYFFLLVWAYVVVKITNWLDLKNNKTYENS